MRRWIIIFLSVLFIPFSFSVAQDEDEVLAVIGEETITIGDLRSTITEAYPVILAFYRGEQGKQRLLRELVDRKLFSQEARREGLDKQSRVQRKIDAAIEKILSDELIAQMVSSLKPPSEEELIKFYENHKERFQTPEQVRVRHILLKTEEEAREVLSLIKAGEDFVKLAEERCSDCVPKKAGQLWWLARGQMPYAFEQVAFSLKKGEVSGIVRTEQGYHIIQSEDRRGPRQRPFFEVKSGIRKQLLNQQREHIIELNRKQLEKKYSVRVYPELLSKVTVPSDKLKMMDEDFLDAMRGKSLLDLIK